MSADEIFRFPDDVEVVCSGKTLVGGDYKTGIAAVQRLVWVVELEIAAESLTGGPVNPLNLFLF